MREKIKSRLQLEELIQKLKRENKIVVFTNGCFDILHVGHIRYLEAAKALGDVLIVGINSDCSVAELKGAGRPIVTQADRAEIISALAVVDYVTIFDEDTPEKLIEFIQPDVHVKGGDYLFKDIPEERLVRSYGGKLHLVDWVEGYSTTSIIEKIRKQEATKIPPTGG